MTWCRDRVQGGCPIIEHQAVGTYLAEMYTGIEAARTYAWRAAWAADNPRQFQAPYATLPKLIATEVAFDAARKALELFGGAGVMRETGIEKLLRDAAMFLHANGTNMIMRLRIANHVRGLAKDPRAIRD